MPPDTLHHDVLIETARLELDHAHRAVLAVEAGDIRRGVAMAMAALQEALSDGLPCDGGLSREALEAVVAKLAQAQTDLDAGALAELGNLLESARKELNQSLG